MNVENKPKVSVLMAVYNQEAHLKEAIDSILGQSLKDLELIIVNDASTDKSEDIVRSCGDKRIRSIKNGKNLGLARSLNLGLEQARADLIARQDADDISFTNRLEKQVNAFKDNDSLALLGTFYRSINGQGNKGALMRTSTDPLILRFLLLFHNKFGHSTVMFKKDVVEQLGGYNEAYMFNQDYDLWSRLQTKSEIGVIPEELCYRRDVYTPSDIPDAQGIDSSPASQISVNNLKELTQNSLSQEQYLFLHKLFGAGVLPEEIEEIKENITAYDQILEAFIKKYDCSSRRGKLEKILIERLLIFVSPKYPFNRWKAIFGYLFRLNPLATICLTIKKIMNRFLNLFRR